MTTRERSGWARWIWLSLSVVAPVAISVASNQVLTDDGWSWGWSAIAVVLAAAGAAVAYRLTRTAPADPAVDAAAPPKSSDRPGQVIEDTTARGSIDLARQVKGNLRLRDSSTPASPPPGAPSPAPASPPAPQEGAPARSGAGQSPDEGGDEPPPAGGQRISGVQAGGSISMVDGVGGDVTIERL